LSKLYWGFDIESYFESNAWWIYPAVFVAGFLAAAACILPGLSGALILYILGFYDPIVALYIGSNSMLHNHDRVVSGLLLSLILIFGIVLGFVAASKFMKSLLARHHSETMFVVLGFLLGSFVSTFVNQSVFSNGNWMYLTARPWEWVVGPLLLIAVSVGFFFLSKISSKKKITNIQQ
jgi:uncharacterized membrane protein